MRRVTSVRLIVAAALALLILATSAFEASARSSSRSRECEPGSRMSSSTGRKSYSKSGTHRYTYRRAKTTQHGKQTYAKSHRSRSYQSAKRSLRKPTTARRYTNAKQSSRYSYGRTKTGTTYRRTMGSRPATTGSAGRSTVAKGKQLTLTGQVTAVNSSKRQIQIRAANGSLYTVRIPSSARFTSAGRNGRFSDIKMGDRIEVTGSMTGQRMLNAQRVNSPRVAPSGSRPSSSGGAGVGPGRTGMSPRTTTIKGQVTGVTQDKREVRVRASDGKTYTVTVPANAQLMARGRKVSISDLKSGMQVNVTGEMTGSDRLTAKSLNEVPGQSGSTSPKKSGGR